VFPCRSADEVTDEYDKETGEIVVYKAKTPLVSNGFKGATLSDRIVKELWKRNPNAVIGIPTGKRTGVFVLDIDVKEGVNGYEWVDAMESLHGDFPQTAMASTPSGGRHYYFKYVEGTRNRMDNAIGVDLRSEGGFVVAPGSVMTSGKSYEWIDHDGVGLPTIADAPDWLLEMIIKPEPVATNYTYDHTRTSNTAYVDKAIDDELSRLSSVPLGGGRNIELNKSAFCLGTFVGANALGENEARNLLRNVAHGWGRDLPLCYKTIENGLASGIRQPRHIPEPSFQSDNDNTKLVDISRMIANGLKKGKPGDAATSEEARLDARRDIVDYVINHPEEELSHLITHDEATAIGVENAAEPTGPIVATAFKWIDPKTLPRREFIFGPHYIRKYVSVTSSPGGLGKTASAVVEALSMTSGKALLGIKPPKPLNVWLFNAEDPRDELERRIMAACIHYKLNPKDIEGRLFLDTGREQELVIAVDNKKGVVIQEPIVEAVVAQIQKYNIDVMIIDPFVSTHNVNENDNGAIDKVAKLWANIADRTNCAIDVVHHLRKVSDREATVEDSRGAVSLLAAARSARVLNRMSEDQATQAGVGKEDRFGYFSVTYGKSNLTPMSHRLDWRKLESTPLGNGRGLTKPQDFAPVVTEWKWPSAEDIAQGVTPQQLEHIKTLVDNAEYKEGNRAKNWAGYAIAYALGIDLEEEANRKRAGSILKALLKEGELKKSEEKDTIRRESAVFIRSAGQQQ
jgi:RecA-family ATPase